MSYPSETDVYRDIDERGLEESDASSFCGTGYVLVKTYDNMRRATDVLTVLYHGLLLIMNGAMMNDNRYLFVGGFDSEESFWVNALIRISWLCCFSSSLSSLSLPAPLTVSVDNNGKCE